MVLLSIFSYGQLVSFFFFDINELVGLFLKMLVAKAIGFRNFIQPSE